MSPLSFLAFGQTELFKFLGAVNHATKHNLAGHRETTRVHLTYDYSLLLARTHINLVTAAFEGLL